MLSIHYSQAFSHANRHLGMNQKAMNKAIEQISSGYRINTAADGPADLIQSETLRSQIEGLERVMADAKTSANMLAAADSSLGLAAELLRSMKALALSAANAGVRSSDQIAADQAAMDSSLQALERLLNNASAGGTNILANMQLEGLLGSDFGTWSTGNGDLVSIGVNPDRSLTELDWAIDGTLVGATTFLITHEDGGTTLLAFRAGQTMADILAAMREYPDALQEGDGEAEGQIIAIDAAAVREIAALGDDEAKARLTEYINDAVPCLTLNGLGSLRDAEWSLYKTALELSGMNLFSLGGTQILVGYDENDAAIYQSYSLKDLYSGGAADLLRSPEAAMQVIDAALKGVLSARAHIGATVNMMGYAGWELESLTRMESALRDKDIAEGSMELARAQLLTQSCMAVMGQARKQQEMLLDMLGALDRD